LVALEGLAGKDQPATQKFRPSFFKLIIYLFIPNYLSRTVLNFKSLPRSKRKINTNLRNNKTTGMMTENATIEPHLTRTPREETSEEEIREKADENVRMRRN